MNPITIELHDLIGDRPNSPPADVRLAQALKVLLRRYGFKATWAPCEHVEKAMSQKTAEEKA